MKYCFPIAKDKGTDSKVFAHFGGAPMFLIVDADDRTTELITPPPREGHGGCAPVGLLAGHSFDALVAGGIGAGAVARLAQIGKKVFLAGAHTIAENLELLANGALKECGAAGFCDSPGHGNGHGHGHTHGHGHGHGGGCGHRQ